MSKTAIFNKLIDVKWLKNGQSLYEKKQRLFTGLALQPLY